MLKRALSAAPALILALGLAACGDSDDGTEARDDTSSSPTDESSEPTETATETVTEETGAGSCEYVPDGTDAGVAPPSASPSEAGEVPVTLTTSVGDLGLTLDAANAPCTVNSFVSLAEQGYFDGTTCHRMTTEGIFVLQCGDPTGTGTGGPGYSFADELKGTETYGTGTLAMANAGPDTNGSQFFIVYGDSPLPPDYTVFGQADDDAVATIEQVAADGTTPQLDGAPNTKVDIEAVSVG